MSSPIAIINKNFVRKFLISFHQKATHNRRVEVLSNYISDIIKDYFKQNQNIKCVDVGCGDMKISELVSNDIEFSKWTGIDLYDLPEEKVGENQIWSNYKSFDGKSIPFEDKTFDIAIIVDVLHHDWDNIKNLLSESARVSKYVIIKDHFEYGIFSRSLLRLMDFVGNWAYGVSVPKKYLTKNIYSNILMELGLTEIKNIEVKGLYPTILESLIIKSKYQFISIIKR